MLDAALRFLLSIRPIDVLDILVVSGLVYSVLALLRDARSTSAVRGVIGVAMGGLILYTTARALRMTATVLLFEKFWIVVVIAMVLVFHQDIRKAISEFGQVRAFRRFFDAEASGLEEVLKAVRKMSREKVGALICIERREPLKRYADTGAELDALVSDELLRTIFGGYSPLHDGAVMIRGARITAAGCILPLTENTALLPKEVGTRHKAALGLSEETDAVVVVVSEETGIVSLAVDGKLERNHTLETLRETLKDILEITDDHAETVAV